MKRAILALIALLFIAPASAQMNLLTGAGGKFKAATAASYQGPGDVFSTSAIGFWSCARVWNAAAASTSTSLCDLNAATGGAAVCTLRGSSSGFVDLTAYCPGSLTPSAACAAASGGSCIVSKVYNQVSPGTADLSQATAANMPPLVFNSTPRGTLPAINCGGGPTYILSSSSTITQSQPYTLSVVYVRDDATSSWAFGPSSGAIGIGGNASTANQASVSFATNVGITGATDSSWHALSGLGNGASGASNLDGTDASASAGSTNMSGSTMRFCRPNATQFGGKIAEGILWGASTNSTNRGGINTNQHSSANGYNF